MKVTKKVSHGRIDLDAVTREYLESEFQRAFFEAAVRCEPDNLECLVQLGDIYNRQGQYEKGLEIDHQLTELCPDEPTFFYNLACSYSLLHRVEESLTALRQAIALGYEDFDYMERDEDLENVRHCERFRELLSP